MRRMLLGGLLAATLVAPAVSLAAPERDPSAVERFHQIQTDGGAGRLKNNKPVDQPANPSSASIGGGMVGGNEPGHVTGPGSAPIDNDSRGPINDVQPGRGTNDTRQSTDPPPARY